MFVLTGDIHHLTLQTRDQALLDPGTSELMLCEKYLEAANACGIAPTIFVSGRVVLEERDLLTRLARKHSWEIGGHTFDCYKPRFLYGLSRRFLGQANGPRWLQQMDARRTLHALRESTGQPISSWRNHAYREDRHTKAILMREGIRALSNGYQPECLPAFQKFADGRMLIAPINVRPDHEHLQHADPLHGDDVASWAAQVFAQVSRNEQQGIPSIILAHPACMEIEDGMAAFRVLVRRLSQFRSVTFCQLGDALLKTENAW